MEWVIISQDWQTGTTIVPIIIAFISLIISMWVAWSNRKSLHVHITKNPVIISKGEIFVISEFDGSKYQEAYENSLLMKIEIVNPSPKDIAYFDLRCFDIETNKNIWFLTKQSMSEENRNKTVWRESKDGKNMAEITIPEKKYGVLKSGTFTSFDILVIPDKDLKKIRLTFSVAKNAIKKIFMLRIVKSLNIIIVNIILIRGMKT